MTFLASFLKTETLVMENYCPTIISRHAEREGGNRWRGDQRHQVVNPSKQQHGGGSPSSKCSSQEMYGELRYTTPCGQGVSGTLLLHWWQLFGEETRQEESGGKGDERGRIVEFSLSIILKNESDSNSSLYCCFRLICVSA